MLLCAQYGLFARLQQLGNALPCFELIAQGKGVDEEADQVFRFAALPPSCGATDDDVVLSREAR